MDNSFSSWFSFEGFWVVGLLSLLTSISMKYRIMKISELHFCQILCLGLMLLLGNFTTPVSAQNQTENVSQRFKRVRHLQDIRSGAEYLVTIRDSIIEYKVWVHKWFALSSIADSKKLSAVTVQECAQDYIDTDDETLQWKLVSVEGKWQLISLSNNRYLYADGTNLSTNAKKVTNWDLYPVGDGAFYLKNLLEDRCLATNMTNSTTCHFGCYKDEHLNGMRVELYVKPMPFVDKGNLLLPTSDCSVVLNCRDSLYTIGATDQVVSYEYTTHICADGLVANDGTLSFLQYKYYGDNRFALYDTEGVALSQDLRRTDDAYIWTEYNGYITTDDSVRRYLVKSDDGICLMTLDEALQSNVSPIGISCAGLPVASETLDNFSMTLTGAWSAKRLANLDWSRISVLDLRKISLPLQPLDFTNRPSDANTIVYINESCSSVVPQSWHFVVSCDQEGNNRLIRSATLLDKVNLSLPYPFYAERGALTYAREMYDDGGWETLCLPFDCAVPNDVSAAKCLSIENGKLHCEGVDEISAGNPVLIRNTLNAGTQTNITFTNLAGWVTDVKNIDGPLQGTYSEIKFNQSANSEYLLNNSGTEFVRVQSGSSLLPFRALLHTKANAALQIFPSVSSISHVINESQNVNVYSIDGKCIKTNVNVKSLSTLPPGVYIVNGRKYIK